MRARITLITNGDTAMNTNEYLDLIKSTKSITSDYKLAQLLDISRSRLSAYRNKPRNMDDDLVLKVEKILDLPEGVVLFEMHSKRTNCPQAAQIFHEISQKLAAGALAVVLAVSVSFAPAEVSAGQNDRCNYVYYVKYQIRTCTGHLKQLNFIFWPFSSFSVISLLHIQILWFISQKMTTTWNGKN